MRSTSSCSKKKQRDRERRRKERSVAKAGGRVFVTWPVPAAAADSVRAVLRQLYPVSGRCAPAEMPTPTAIAQVITQAISSLEERGKNIESDQALKAIDMSSVSSSARGAEKDHKRAAAAKVSPKIFETGPTLFDLAEFNSAKAKQGTGGESTITSVT